KYYSQKSTFKFTTLRLAQVFGYGEKYINLPLTLMQNAVMNRPIELWEGVENDRRSYVYIKDVAIAFIHFLKTSISGVFNISLCKSYSPDELAKIILIETPTKSEIVRISSLSATPRNDEVSVEKAKEYANWSCRWQMGEALHDYWLELYNSKS
ncbi:MAG: NAD-dependent epimerase/dehydratase family protein, partial [bacterium]